MTTLDLDALERAARAGLDSIRQSVRNHWVTGKPTERQIEAVAAQRPAYKAIVAQRDAIRALQERVEGAEKAIAEAIRIYQDDDKGDESNVETAMFYALFAARTKAGEPHEQE